MPTRLVRSLPLFLCVLTDFLDTAPRIAAFCSSCGEAQEPFYLMCINPHFAFCPIFAIRWPSHRAPSNTKRHSEGTFTSDFTRYLDKMKAKDFVHWLINTKRYR